MASTTCSPPADFSGTAVPKVWNLPARRSLFGDAVLIVFLLAQCFDGVFTYVGVVSFGLGIEANPLVAGLMASIGHGAGLFAAKAVAIVLGIGLHLRQVHGAVALLAGFYLFVAVLPWMAILFS
jgi:uncharacterized membrane protein